MISVKGHSSGGVRVSADSQAGVTVTGNRPTAWLTLRASMFAAVSTSSPSGIHDYAIAFSGVAPARLSAQLAVSPLVSAGHLGRQPQLPTCGSRSEEHT